MLQAGTIRRHSQPRGERLISLVFLLVTLSAAGAVYLGAGLLAYVSVFIALGHEGIPLSVFGTALVGAMFVHHAVTLIAAVHFARGLWTSVSLVVTIVAVAMLVALLPLLLGLTLASACSAVGSVTKDCSGPLPDFSIW